LFLAANAAEQRRNGFVLICAICDKKKGSPPGKPQFIECTIHHRPTDWQVHDDVYVPDLSFVRKNKAESQPSKTFYATEERFTLS